MPNSGLGLKGKLLCPISLQTPSPKLPFPSEWLPNRSEEFQESIENETVSLDRGLRGVSIGPVGICSHEFTLIAELALGTAPLFTQVYVGR